MNKSRYITDAAMTTALIGILLFINQLSSGFLVLNFAFLFPIPLTLYGLRYDYKKSLIPAGAIVLLSLIINWITGLIFVLPSMIVGVLYVFAFKNFAQKPYIRLVIMFLGSIVVNVLTTIVFSKLLFGIGVIEDTILLTNELIDMMKMLNFPITSFVEQTLRIILVSVIPAITVVYTIIETIVTYLLIAIMANRIFKIELGASIVAYNIKVPSILTYILLPLSFISVFFVQILADYQYITFWLIVELVGINVFVILLFAYVVEAIVLLSIYSSKTRNRGLFVILILMMFVLMPFLILIGIIDSVFNLRKKLLI